jgi:transposase-like protein
MLINMPYSENFKRKMIQKLTGPDAVSATSLSKQVDVSQTSLSKWLKKASIVTPNVNLNDSAIMRPSMPSKRPEDWSPEEKLNISLKAATLSDQQLGAFLRQKGIHETHLQQWRLQMLNGLGKTGTMNGKVGRCRLYSRKNARLCPINACIRANIPGSIFLKQTRFSAIVPQAIF